MTLYSPRQWTLALAVLGTIGFIVCFFWGTLLSDPEIKEMHMDMLRMSFLGFSGINISSFMVGMLQAAAWGAVVGWALASFLNMFARK